MTLLQIATIKLLLSKKVMDHKISDYFTDDATSLNNYEEFITSIQPTIINMVIKQPNIVGKLEQEYIEAIAETYELKDPDTIDLLGKTRILKAILLGDTQFQKEFNELTL